MSSVRHRKVIFVLSAVHLPPESGVVVADVAVRDLPSADDRIIKGVEIRRRCHRSPVARGNEAPDPELGVVVEFELNVVVEHFDAGGATTGRTILSVYV